MVVSSRVTLVVRGAGPGVGAGGAGIRCQFIVNAAIFARYQIEFSLLVYRCILPLIYNTIFLLQIIL